MSAINITPATARKAQCTIDTLKANGIGECQLQHSNGQVFVILSDRMLPDAVARAERICAAIEPTYVIRDWATGTRIWQGDDKQEYDAKLHSAKCAGVIPMVSIDGIRQPVRG